MQNNPDADGRYRDRAARSIAEWKKWQKIWSTKYDFCKSPLPKAKSKRKLKPKFKDLQFRGTARNLQEHEARTNGFASKPPPKKKSSQITEPHGNYKGKRVNERINIFVKTPLATLETFTVKQQTLVEHLKELLCDKLGVAAGRQELYAGSLKMCNLLSLEDHGISNESNIELRISSGLLGGADKSTNGPEKNSENKSESSYNATCLKLSFQEPVEEHAINDNSQSSSLESFSVGPQYFDPSGVTAALKWIQQQSSELEAGQRLEENCRRAGLTFHGDTSADGNCFFNAVSDQLSLLGLVPQSSKELRKSVVDFLKNNQRLQGPDGIIELSATQPDWKAYCEAMVKDGEWADAIVVVATAHMLQRDILVVTSSPQSTPNKAYHWIAAGTGKSKGLPLTLGHVWEWHYRSLQAIDVGMNNEPWSLATLLTTMKEVAALREEGEHLHKAGNLSGAVSKYEQAESLLEPTQMKLHLDEHKRQEILITIYHEMVLCLLKLKKSSKALLYSKRALFVDPVNGKALFTCGQAYFQMGLFYLAKEYMQQALKQCPNDPIITEELHRVIKKVGELPAKDQARYNDERQRHEKALIIYLKLADYFLKLDKPAKALSYGKKVLQSHPSNEKALIKCGQAYCQMNNFDRAYKYMLNAQMQSPGDPFIREELAKIKEKNDQAVNSVLRRNDKKESFDDLNQLENKQPAQSVPTVSSEKDEVSRTTVVESKGQYSTSSTTVYSSSEAQIPKGSHALDRSEEMERERIRHTLDGATEILCSYLAPGYILRRLKAAHVMTDDDVREIDHPSGTEEKVDRMLGFIKKKDARAYREFMTVLSEDREDLHNIVKEIEKSVEADLKKSQAERVEIPAILKNQEGHQAEFVKGIAQQLKAHYLNTVCKKQLYPWEKGEYVDLSDIYVHLTMDMEIPKPCKPIKQRLDSYHVIFSDEETNMRFALEGRPGLGKTSLCAKIAYDWSEPKAKNVFLKHIRLLFILQLGRISHKSNFEDAIREQLLPSLDVGDAQKLCKAIRRMGKSVVIVLDSLDEADPNLFKYEEHGNIVKAITYDDFQNCRVLVTTRPWRIGEITKIPSYRRLELQGFIRSDILTFVDKFFNQAEDVFSSVLGTRLLAYIEQNKLVVDASIPLMILLICWYWQKTVGKEAIPRSVCQLYDGVIDVMYKSISKKGQLSIQKDSIVAHLGYVALQGLSPTKTQLVFSRKEIVKYCPEEVINAGCDMGLISRKGEQPNSIAFFHKTGQEKLAGDFLANHPVEMELYLKTVKTVKDALNVGLVLISSAAKGVETATKVLTRLQEIFEAEIQPKILEYYKEKSSLDDTRTIQQYIELCLECNYEIDSKSQFNAIFETFFVNGNVYLFGIQPYPAVALGYYLTHSERDTIRAFILRPIAHPSDPQVTSGPTLEIFFTAFKWVQSLPDTQIRKISSGYLTKYRGNLHAQVLRLDPADLVSYIQCMQACEGLPSASETNIVPIIDSFKYLQLKTFDCSHFKFGNSFNYIINAIEDGHLKSLEEFYVRAIAATGRQITRLVKALHKMPLLLGLDISYNEIETGETLRALPDNITGCRSLQGLNVGEMYAPAKDMEVLTEKLPQLNPGLAMLDISGNYMNDVVATNLASSLPNEINSLSMNLLHISKDKHNELLLALGKLKCLHQLSLYHSTYPTELVECVGRSLHFWSDIVVLVLTVHPKIFPIVIPEAWLHMKSALQAATKLKRLWLSNIALEEEDFLELISIARDKCYSELRYSKRCLPDDISIPEDDFFNLH